MCFQIPHIPQPSATDVEKYLSVYIQHLTDLHERHKHVHEAITGEVSEMRIVE